MGKDKIVITKGDTENISLSITDEDGSPFDLTGHTVHFSVKRNIDDADAGAVLQKTVTTHLNPGQGQTVIALDDTDTAITPGVYIYDVQVSKPSPKFVRTVLKDIFEVVEDVTDTTA